MTRHPTTQLLGHYQRPAMIAFGLNVCFSLLTVTFSVVGLIWNRAAG